MRIKYLYCKIVALLIMIITASSCRLEGNLLPQGAIAVPTGTANIAGDYYFKGTLNGQAVSWLVTDDLQGWVTGSAAATSENLGVVTGSLSALISNAGTLTPQLQVEIGEYNVKPGDDKTATFNSFVTTGPIPFGTGNNAANAKFITISYTDKQGNFYNSATGDQTGSSINIITVTPVPISPGRNESLKIKLSFNCKLYPDSGTGNALTLTNAEATVRLEDLL